MAVEDSSLGWNDLCGGLFQVRIRGAGIAVTSELLKLCMPYWREVPSGEGGVVLADFTIVRGHVAGGPYELEVHQGQVSLIFGLTDKPTSIALVLLSLIRALAKMNSELHGCGLNFHAGCIIFRGRGIAITGERRAGKTTLVLDSLNKGGAFVANDQLMLGATSEGIQGNGHPALVSVRDSTALSRLVKVAPTRSRAGLDGAADGVRREYSVHDIVSAYGAKVCASTPVRLLLLYAHDPDLDVPSFESISSSQWVEFARLPLTETYSPSTIETACRVLGSSYSGNSIGAHFEGVRAIRVQSPFGYLDAVTHVCSLLKD